MIWQTDDPCDLLSRIEALGKHDRVIDWGCGKNGSPISQWVKQLDCDLLVSVDAWLDNIKTVDENQAEYRCNKHLIVREEIQDYVRQCIDEEEHFNLSLCLDIVEHMEKDEAIRWLADVESISDKVLIWIPLGKTVQWMDYDWWGNNDYYNAHRSDWTKEDLEELGYECEILEDFHTGMFERFGERVHGCWAYKIIKHTDEN